MPNRDTTKPTETRPTLQHIVTGRVSNSVDTAQLALPILAAVTSLRIQDRRLRLHDLPAPNTNVSASSTTATAAPTTTYVSECGYMICVYVCACVCGC